MNENFNPQRSKQQIPPSSPLRVISRHDTIGSVPSSPVPLTDSSIKDWPVIPKPRPLSSPGVPMTGDSNQEDQEVVEIVKQGEQLEHKAHRTQQCDSVLQEFQVRENCLDYNRCINFFRRLRIYFFRYLKMKNMTIVNRSMVHLAHQAVSTCRILILCRHLQLGLTGLGITVNVHLNLQGLKLLIKTVSILFSFIIVSFYLSRLIRIKSSSTNIG